jgi:sugar O-acyltransferase (sialic acid O-acetyltransferase NeuD family)
VEYYIVGAGGQARQILSIAKKAIPDLGVRGFIGLDKEKGKIINGLPCITESDILSVDRRNVVLLNGLGRPNRRNAIERSISLGFKFQSLVHPSANVEDYVSIGYGSVIQAGVGIMTNVEVGKFVLIDMNATVGHDMNIGDYSTISTGVNMAGGVKVGKGCWIGSGTTIIEDVNIGDNVLIGAGSVVTRDIEKIAWHMGTLQRSSGKYPMFLPS